MDEDGGGEGGTVDEDGGVDKDGGGEGGSVDEDGCLAREIRHPSLLCGESGINVWVEKGIIEPEEVVDVVPGVGESDGVVQEEEQEQEGGETKPVPLKAHCIASLSQRRPCKFSIQPANALCSSCNGESGLGIFHFKENVTFTFNF